MDIHRMLDKYAVEIGQTEHKLQLLRAEKQGIQQELSRTNELRDREREAMQQELNALSALSYEIKHLAATIKECQAQNDTLKQDIAREQSARKALAAEADSAKESFISACRQLDHEMRALVAGKHGISNDAGEVDTHQGRDQWGAEQRQVTQNRGRAGRAGMGAMQGGEEAGEQGGTPAAAAQEGGSPAAAAQEGGNAAGSRDAEGERAQGAEHQAQGAATRHDTAEAGAGGKQENDHAEGGGSDQQLVEVSEVEVDVAAEGAMLAAVVTLP